MTGLTRQKAAEAVASLFGTMARQTHESRIYDPWEVIDNEGKKWRFVYDSSIHGSQRIGRQQVSNGDGTYKVEMNSPKLEYSEMGKLQEVVRALRHAGAVVNPSCGMHVHVDASKHTPQSLKNALSIMYSKEDILFKALNVNESRVERWCQKVREPMLEKIRKLPTNTTMDRLRQEWYEGSDGSYEHYNWTRYYLEAQVKESGLPREEFLRTLIMGAELRAKPCEHHADLLHKAAGLCNNANQLAKVANTYGEASQQDIEEMTKLARQVWEEVKNNW